MCGSNRSARGRNSSTTFALKKWLIVYLLQRASTTCPTSHCRSMADKENIRSLQSFRWLQEKSRGIPSFRARGMASVGRRVALQECSKQGHDHLQKLRPHPQGAPTSLQNAKPKPPSDPRIQHDTPQATLFEKREDPARHSTILLLFVLSTRLDTTRTRLTSRSFSFLENCDSR